MDSPQRITRLSVNINAEAATYLQSTRDRTGHSVTEILRRAIAIHKLVEDELAAGSRFQIVNGNDIREIEWMP